MGNKITITRRRTVIDERYTRPQGLYPCRDVDQRKLRRLILESKLAPCYPGAEEADKDLEECPICFLQYPSLNRSKCCAKGICTECFLQMKAPHAARPTQCPFCKTPCYAVEYRGAKTLEEKGMEQAEEQKVIEAKIRMRQQELQDDEEREQRREQDMIRLQTPRALPNTNHLTAIAPIDDMEGVNWRSGWGSADRQPQVLETSALEERNTSGMDPHVQQSTVSISSNITPPVTQQTDFATPQFPPGAPRARHREDEFDLDLEDIMVMEAIWLSIQEQGARHRCSNAEPIRARRAESLTEISLDSESDDVPAHLPPPLHPVPEAQPWEPQGTLAGAIAALAERQAVDGDSIMPATFPSSRAGEEALENTPESESSRGESSGGVKGSFEEQMVLAMALSIADAQTRVHQPGDSRSGPLLQPAPHMGH